MEAEDFEPEQEIASALTQFERLPPSIQATLLLAGLAVAFISAYFSSYAAGLTGSDAKDYANLWLIVGVIFTLILLPLHLTIRRSLPRRQRDWLLFLALLYGVSLVLITVFDFRTAWLAIPTGLITPIMTSVAVSHGLLDVARFRSGTLAAVAIAPLLFILIVPQQHGAFSRNQECLEATKDAILDELRESGQTRHRGPRDGASCGDIAWSQTVSLDDGSIAFNGSGPLLNSGTYVWRGDGALEECSRLLSACDSVTPLTAEWFFYDRVHSAS